MWWEVKQIRFKKYGRKAVNRMGDSHVLRGVRYTVIGSSTRRAYGTYGRLWVAQDELHNQPHQVTLRTDEIRIIQQNQLVPLGYEDTYIVWDGVIRRCTIASNTAYKNYGAKGIGVYNLWNPEWYRQHDNSLDRIECNRRAFMQFCSDKGLRPLPSPRQFCLDRIKPNDNYIPSNTRWIPDYKNSARVRRPKLDAKGIYKSAMQKNEEH